MKKPIFHLIPNAHLDPVWLWDRYEGLAEGLNTAISVLDLMDEFPELTFSRGESFTYRYIERFAPDQFARLRKRVEEGRWEIVGGTCLQMDTNLTGTETFCREYTKGLRYFKETFGFAPKVAWFADSFGHSGGLPEILEQCGMESFIFTRPQENLIHIAEPAFTWVGVSGAQVLGYRPKLGWYGSDRTAMGGRLDETLASLEHSAFRNIGVFMGLGDHGGGPVREQILDIRKWAAAHPEVEVVWSGMQKLIDAVKAEDKAAGGKMLPVIRGELNFTLRGCYVSAARYKTLFRRCEALQTTAESTISSLAALGVCPKTPDLTEAIDGVLFGAFHDLLPGSSIESGFDNQIDWLQASAHGFCDATRDALIDLSARVDTRRSRQPEKFKPGTAMHLVWNPNPWPVTASFDLESCLDARPITQYEGKREALPLAVKDEKGRYRKFQRIHTEELTDWPAPWRKRVVVTEKLPALGWKLMELGWEEGASDGIRTDSTIRVKGINAIASSDYVLSAKVGAAGVKITDAKTGKRILSGEGLQVVTVKDASGSWGGNDTKAEDIDLQEVCANWSVTAVEVLEKGPERATLGVKMAGGDSRMVLRLSLDAASPSIIHLSARLFVNEIHKRIKLLMPFKSTMARFEVPGGVVERAPAGEVPGGRWVDLLGGVTRFGFATDAQYGYNQKRDRLEVSLVRTAYYAHSAATADVTNWREVTDQGELRFNALITTDAGINLPRVARELECPVQAFPVTASAGDLPRTGSIATLLPSNLLLTTFKTAEDGKGFVLRVQEQAGKKVARASFELCGKKIDLGAIPALGIRTFRIRNGKAQSVAVDEG